MESSKPILQMGRPRPREGRDLLTVTQLLGDRSIIQIVGSLMALLGRAPGSRCRDRGMRGAGFPRGVEAAPDELGPQRTLGRSWLWRHWTSWTGVWISWRHCRHGTQWGKWPPTR